MQTVDPLKASGKLSSLWIAFGKFYETAGQIEDVCIFHCTVWGSSLQISDIYRISNQSDYLILFKFSIILLCKVSLCMILTPIRFFKKFKIHHCITWNLAQMFLGPFTTIFWCMKHQIIVIFSTLQDDLTRHPTVVVCLCENKDCKHA